MPGLGIYKDNWHILFSVLLVLLQWDEEGEGCVGPGGGHPAGAPSPSPSGQANLLICCSGSYCMALGSLRQDLGLQEPEVFLASGEVEKYSPSSP